MYVADAAAPLVLGGHISFAALVSSPCAGLLEGGKAAEFAVLAIVQVLSLSVLFLLLFFVVCCCG